jgi:monofunctional chorismate mutase
MDIQDMRKEIDAIDAQLVQLFVERMAVSARIADYKKSENLPIFVPAREREKLADVGKKAGEDMADYVQKLYATIFELSRQYQSEVIR